MTERWGATVLHCPYCHGYEMRDLPLGVLAAHPMSAHQAVLIPDWGPTTYFTQGQFEPEPDHLHAFTNRGVTVERTPVVELLGKGPALDGVRLADGRVIELVALFTAPRPKPAPPPAALSVCPMSSRTSKSVARVPRCSFFLAQYLQRYISAWCFVTTGCPSVLAWFKRLAAGMLEFMSMMLRHTWQR